MATAASTTRKATPSLDLSPVEKVRALLTPKNIAIIGASERPHNWAMRTHRNLLRYGFKGALYPINPKREEIWGVTCYHTLEDLPEAPDHLLVISPAASIPQTLLDAAALGARSATIISAGFAELSDPASQALTKRLVEVIKETGLAVSGPNCVGNINGAHPLMTNFEDREARITPGPVALISQSGGVGMLIKRLLEERSVDCGMMVTSGSELGLTIGDYIEYAAQDEATKVIICYLEGLRDPSRFLDGCRAASRADKPVVVVKTGVSEAGREASVAHTGSLAGSIMAFDSVAAKNGVIRVATLDELVEMTEYFAHAKPVRGSRIGAMSTSGGKRGIMIDAGDAAGLFFPKLAQSTIDRLGTVLGVGSDINNPLDAGFAANVSQEAYMTSVTSLIEDPNVDMLLLEGELPRTVGSARREGYLHAVNELAGKSDKPIVYISVASYGFTDYTRDLRAQLPNVAYLQGSDRTCAALAAAIKYAARKMPTDTPTRARPAGRREKLHALLDAALSNVLDEVSAKAVLDLYGVPLPKEAIARSAGEARTFASQIGFPVVLKVVSPDLPHKSDVGGVILNVGSADAAEQAYNDIMARVMALPGKPVVEGILVAEQVLGGVEVVLGTLVDPELGPMILFGSGGVAIELFKDFGLAACPVAEDDAEELIDRTKAGTLIGTFRGRPAMDRKAITSTMMALSDLMLDAGDRIVSIEINPFSVRGTGGACLDALIVKNVDQKE
ncbi:acetate--CoA ligase family protein [Corticibacterium sp. UT-5YL-CI-8]|nr:acetate--CoA ligase family protein [Tianweitania sp. UT-5YL-CI-8]